jgi:hypothetical protein
MSGIVAALLVHVAAAAETADLSVDAQQPVRVEVRLDATGDLKLLETVGTDDGGKSRSKTKSVPVDVQARLRYHDRPLTAERDIERRSIRQYEVAQATLKVGKGELVNKLDEPLRTIVVAEGERADLFSPAGPLTSSQVDLITVAFDSGLLPTLLPAKKVQLGHAWAIEAEPLARLLRWEVITSHEATARLEKVEKQLATIRIEGKASGGVDGIASEAQFVGTLTVDVGKRCCTWLAMTLKEQRTASQGAPGFDTTTQIRLVAAPASVPPELTDEAIAEAKLLPDAGTRLLRYESTSQRFSCVHEPQWHVVSDQPEAAVLRYMERGDLVAQCNLSRLKPLGKGEQLTLEAFQENLRGSLGSTFREYVEAGESLTEGGLRVLRVVISASVSDVPIQYVFFHLSDDHQNRLSLAITMDAEQAERFGRAEETLINSLQFVPDADPPTATSVRQTSKSKNR